MWEVLDFRDKALVRLQVHELRQEAAMRRLVREARAPRRSVVSLLAGRLWRRQTVSE